MTNVRAGAEQRGCTPGQTGLATVWVRSDSEEHALEQARQIIGTRRYEAFGELTAFCEDLGDGGTQDPVAAGYTSMKQRALSQGDGLFELWFPLD